MAGFGAAQKLMRKGAPVIITNFEECAAAGNPIGESYPRQCWYGGRTFVENIGNELEKADLIRVYSPRPNQAIRSPLTITGEARGYWFFEASFPVVLTDGDGLIMAQGIATAQIDPATGEINWMTTDFVPFEAELAFTVDKNALSNKGTLILHKDNPSGLPEHDDALEIPLVFADINQKSIAECIKNSDCPTDFECVQECGPPVISDSDNTPLKFYCQPEGYIRRCPICLAKNTLIDTPLGAIPVQDIQKGMTVWTLTPSGRRIMGVVIEASKTPVPPEHKMVEFVLDDGRALFVSPGHPTIDGRAAGDLVVGDLYDGARVTSSKRVFYGGEATYDILPSGKTGYYFANGILLGSALRP